MARSPARSPLPPPPDSSPPRMYGNYSVLQSLNLPGGGKANRKPNNTTPANPQGQHTALLLCLKVQIQYLFQRHAAHLLRSPIRLAQSGLDQGKRVLGCSPSLCHRLQRNNKPASDPSQDPQCGTWGGGDPSSCAVQVSVKWTLSFLGLLLQ